MKVQPSKGFGEGLVSTMLSGAERKTEQPWLTQLQNLLKAQQKQLAESMEGDGQTAHWCRPADRWIQSQEVWTTYPRSWGLKGRKKPESGKNELVYKKAEGKD